jgi:DNA-binding HxlR family transcriptional regulator
VREWWDDAQDVIDLVAHKWVLSVLRALQEGPRRHNELLRALQGIHPKVLSVTLHRMENAGLVRREVRADSPPGVYYGLTALAGSLVTVLAALAEWADCNRAQLVSLPGWPGMQDP